MKNNAKKRKLYEAFIETLPLLTSLEVSGRVTEKLFSGFFFLTHCDSYVFLSTALREDEGCGCPIYQGLQ